MHVVVDNTGSPVLVTRDPTQETLQQCDLIVEVSIVQPPGNDNGLTKDEVFPCHIGESRCFNKCKDKVGSCGDRKALEESLLNRL